MVRRTLNQDPHTLTGAYALNALTPSESLRFEDHLAHCESCFQEVRGFFETSALLASATARTPPPGLRERVLAEVAETRQLAPAPERLPEPRRRGRSLFPALALAACLLLILVLGAVVIDQSRRVDELRAEERRIAAVLASPDSISTRAEPMEGVSVTVVSSEIQGALVFSAHGLETLDEEDYQLWLTRADGGVVSAGVLSVDASGFVSPVLAAPSEEDEGIAVTIEPEGGSEHPTSEPVMAMPVTD